MIISETKKNSTEKTLCKKTSGTAVIIKKSIKCIELDLFKKDYTKATAISTSHTRGAINISTVYCPLKFNNTKDQYLDFLKSLGNRYLAGGDYNTKHITWVSRITTAKDVNCMKQ